MIYCRKKSNVHRLSYRVIEEHISHLQGRHSITEQQIQCEPIITSILLSTPVYCAYLAVCI